MKFTYKPQGVCSQLMNFDIDENDKIVSLEVIGGCKGNLSGISSILVGMDVNHVIERFSGVQCGFKGTSCPDQIAKGLQSYLATK